MNFKQSCQISIDLLLALILFLIIIGILLNYVNDFGNIYDQYNKNASGFEDYIIIYDFLKSVDKSNTNYTIYFNKDINFYDNKIVFDENNNYYVSVLNVNCDIVTKECDKS